MPGAILTEISGGISAAEDQHTAAFAGNLYFCGDRIRKRASVTYHDFVRPALAEFSPSARTCGQKKRESLSPAVLTRAADEESFARTSDVCGSPSTRDLEMVLGARPNGAVGVTSSPSFFSVTWAASLARLLKLLNRPMFLARWKRWQVSVGF